MNEDKYYKILSIINKYLYQRKMHPEYIDFYDLYEINPNISFEGLKSKFADVNDLFYIGQLYQIPPVYQQVYTEIIAKNEELFRLSESENKKNQYDKMLSEKKHAKEQVAQPQENNRPVIVSDADIVRSLKNYLERAIAKNGISGGFYSFQNLIYNHKNSAEYIRVIRRETGDYSLANAIMTFVNTVIDESEIVHERAYDFYDSVKDLIVNYGDRKAHDIIWEKMKTDDFKASVYLDKKLTDKSKRTTPTFSKSDIQLLMYARLHRYRDENLNYSFGVCPGKMAGEYFVRRFCEEERKKIVIEKRYA